MMTALPENAHVSAGIDNPVLMAAALALHDNRLHDAEPVLKAHLKRNPYDVAAIRMLAELAWRIGRHDDAENLLLRAVELAPTFIAARSNLAMLLHRQGRSAEALQELEHIAAIDSADAVNPNLKAAALGRIGEYDEAIAIYQQVLAAPGAHPKIWMSYGHVLKTIGRVEDSVTAYRKALERSPGLGEVWWSLANLKTVRFDDADIAAMEAALTITDVSHQDAFHLHFALGKAYDERKSAEQAFTHYEKGNALRRQSLPYDSGDTHRQVTRAKQLYTPEFLAKHKGHGHHASDPIFILGMPRAGSTLIEQILASHSMVEGTMELPDIPALAARSRNGPEGIEGLSGEDLAALGQAYLDRTCVQRKSGKPFYIDKLPNNWMHSGFIHLILPNAKIIDARRHPLDCCFSNFKQHFARGQAFSYGLEDIGRYYADYVDLMAHFDSVLPGRIHRVIHEQLLANTQAEIMALLDYLGLPFEEACLRFYDNDRAVQTASSEQVRRPINRDGVNQWRPYEPHLEPLKQALGRLWQSYPAV
jgi:tetratricopeptide (TPR) repeat protein